MIPSGGLYVLFTALLLLVALGVAIPVLKRLVVDGLERQRTDEATLTADAERSPPAAADSEGTRTCRSCGTANAPDFSYCRECGERL